MYDFKDEVLRLQRVSTLFTSHVKTMRPTQIALATIPRGELPIVFKDDYFSHLDLVKHYIPDVSTKKNGELIRMLEEIEPLDIGGGSGIETMMIDGRAVQYILLDSAQTILESGRGSYKQFMNTLESDNLFIAAELNAYAYMARAKLQNGGALSDDQKRQTQIKADLQTLLILGSAKNEYAEKKRFYEFAQKLADVRQIQFMVTGDTRYYTAPNIDYFVRECREAGLVGDALNVRTLKSSFIASHAENVKYRVDSDLLANRQMLLDGEYVADGYFIDRFEEACGNVLTHSDATRKMTQSLYGCDANSPFMGIRLFHIVDMMGGKTNHAKAETVANIARHVQDFAHEYTENLSTSYASSHQIVPVNVLDKPKTQELNHYLTDVFKQASGEDDFAYNNQMGRISRSRTGEAAKAVAKQFIGWSLRRKVRSLG